jgi:hypothetical protein
MGVMGWWRLARRLVGAALFIAGFWLVWPLILPALLQGQAGGRVVAVFTEPDAGGGQQLRVLFEYRYEQDGTTIIALGEDLAGPAGEAFVSSPLSVAAARQLLARVDAAGGAEQLPCRIFVGGPTPRVYCPLLVGDVRRWRGVVLMAIPMILLFSGLLYQGCRRPPVEPRSAVGVN